MVFDHQLRHVYQALVVQQPLAGGPTRNKFRGVLQKPWPPPAPSRRPGAPPDSLGRNGLAARAAGNQASRVELAAGGPASATISRLGQRSPCACERPPAPVLANKSRHAVAFSAPA